MDIQLKKSLLSCLIIGIISSPAAFAVDYTIPVSTPLNNSNEQNVIDGSSNDIVIKNGSNGYKNLGPKSPVNIVQQLLNDAISNGYVASDIYETAHLNNLIESVDKVEKNIEVKDTISGETHYYNVIDSDKSKFNKADTSNLTLEIYKPRKDLDYVEHTIAEVSSSHTMTIEADSSLTSNWYNDEKHQILTGHRDSNLYTASGTGSKIEYNDKINLAMGWLPVYNDAGGKILVSAGKFYEWSGTIDTVFGTRTITDEASFNSFNNELIAALENGTISYTEYTSNINQAYSQVWKDLPYNISTDPNYNNDSIFINTNNTLLYANKGADIHVSENAEILISDGQFSAITVNNGSTATNDGEITALEHYSLSTVNIYNNSTLTNNGIINNYVTTDGKYSDLTTSSAYLSTVYAVLADNSKFINTGVVNSASTLNANNNATAAAPVAIRLQSGALLSNSGAINFGVTEVTESNFIAMQAAVDMENSIFNNEIDGRLSVGKTAQSDKNDTQDNIEINGTLGKTYGINSKNSVINNDGIFELGKLTSNISLVNVVSSNIQNKEDGTINIAGTNNIGINAFGNTAAGQPDSLITNSGTITLADGENLRGIQANNTNGKGKILVENDGSMVINGNNSFTSSLISSSERNYGMWIEGQNAVGSNNGQIALIDAGAVGIHARNKGRVDVNDDSSVTFSGQGSQIGYFSYGDGSLIQFNNPTQVNNVDSKNSNFARIEDGATLVFNNNPGEFATINLNEENTLGFHVAGNSTGFLADSNIKLNIIGEGATGLLAANGGNITIDKSMQALLSGNNATFAIADGRNYTIDKAIVDGSGNTSLIISNATINDTNATGTGVTGYLANKGGTIQHQGNIDLQSHGDATGIKIDGGTVINLGNISVNGIGVHVIGKDSSYQGAINSLVKATDGQAAFLVDEKAKLNLSGGKVEASNNAHAILVDTKASELSISNEADLSADGSGNVLHNNADITTTISNSLLTAKGISNAVIYHDATNATYNLSGSIIKAELEDQQAVNFNQGNGILVADQSSSITGTIKTNSGATSDVSLTNGSLWNVLYSDSNVTNLTNTTNSIIDLTDQSAPIDPTQITYNILKVDNNYIGGSNLPSENNPQPSGNGTLIVNTLWNKTNSSSDLLAIAGTASGYTEVMTKNGIIGDITRNSVVQYSADVVTVANHTAGSNAFYGFADTVGAGQAILVQKNPNTYAWSIPANNPTNPVNPVKPEVPSYVLTPKANMELGYNILGTLHQRVSEQQTMAWDDCSQCQVEHQKGQVWGRFLGNYLKASGSDRYGYRSKMWGIQLGYDFDIDYDKNEDSRSHTGVMLSYAKDNLKFRDEKHVSFDTTSGAYTENGIKTGTGSVDMFAVGLYSTHYDKNGSYLDLVGQLDYSRIKYNSIASDNVKNHSYGTTLSAEVGRPFALAESQWLIEPQAQLTYQYRNFNDFNTRHDIKVSQDDRQGLRGRLGFRLAYNEGTEELKTKTVYFVGNVIHDLLNSDKNTTIGSDNVREKLARTWGEAGVGLQLPIGETSYIYTDLRYSHSFNNDDGKRKQYTGNLGIKYHF